MSDMNGAPPPEGPLPNLRFLKILVTVLAGTMILGLITIVTLLVIRLPGSAAPSLPASITLPEGAQVDAVTLGRGWVAVVTGGDTILLYDAETGALRQTVTVEH